MLHQHDETEPSSHFRGHNASICSKLSRSLYEHRRNFQRIKGSASAAPLSSAVLKAPFLRDNVIMGKQQAEYVGRRETEPWQTTKI